MEVEVVVVRLEKEEEASPVKRTNLGKSHKTGELSGAPLHSLFSHHIHHSLSLSLSLSLSPSLSSHFLSLSSHTQLQGHS